MAPNENDLPEDVAFEDRVLGAVEDEQDEADAPRRAASAEFAVESRVGSHAILREAMDPANQSLAEALRLSFRVLKGVMIILVILFAFSGIQTVGESESGVMLRGGKILTIDGEEALSPGAHFSGWPYPIGDFVVFPDKDRQTDVGNAFWPHIRPGSDLASMIESAAAHDPLRPGGDGYVLTRGGDIGHLRLTAEYEIDDVVDFVNGVADADSSRDADRIVQLALRNAAIHTAAHASLQDLVEMTDVTLDAIRQEAQGALDRLDCGIRLVDVGVPDSMAPLAIMKSYREVQTARIDAQQILEQAEQDAQRIQTSMAGERFDEFTELISQYESARNQQSEAAMDAALASINELLLDESVFGEVSEIITRAQSYQSMVELTLGHDARRFKGLLPAYRDAPALTVAQLWMDSRAKVLSGPDTEVFYLPGMAGGLTIRIQGSDEIQNLRRDARRRAREQESYNQQEIYRRPKVFTREDVTIEGPGRRLKVQDGSITPQRR